jgi:hypothetical protein
MLYTLVVIVFGPTGTPAITTVPGFTSDFSCFEASTHLAESNSIRAKQGEAEQTLAKKGAFPRDNTVKYPIETECVEVK